MCCPLAPEPEGASEKNAPIIFRAHDGAINADTDTLLQFTVVVYNPFAHEVNHYVRLPIKGNYMYEVTNFRGKKIPSQARLKARLTTAKVNVNGSSFI